MSFLKFEVRFHLTGSRVVVFFNVFYKKRLILETPDLLDVSCKNKNSSAQHKVTFCILNPISVFKFKKK